MLDQNTILEGVHKQFKLIESTRRKWDVTVLRSDKIFTALTYNLMREAASVKSSCQSDEIWSLKLIPQCSTACKVYLAGDPIRAAHLAAARRIEDDFDSLQDLLWNLQECVESVERIVQRLASLHKLKVPLTDASIVLTSPVTSPSRRKVKRGSGRKSEDGRTLLTAEYVPWSMVLEEGEALLHRLHEDLAFRRGLVRALVPTIGSVIAEGFRGPDRGSPQCLCFLWREARQIVKWEHVLDLVEHIHEVAAT
ncbi:unnamed protein product [Hydatigera taeniaeformis]|uniref:DHC_N1 domain-containing protein n=1 Tax=Hydatigena taeniaeformis TaxID=6205 RepID=A0A0R3X097_HYDTA|nr:unnamed protein product [Hydatigera taeniaeformis]